MLSNPLPARIHADEVRCKQNGGLAFDGVKVFHALDTNQAADTLRLRPPQNTAFNETAGEHPEMISHQRLARLVAHLGKAKLYINGAHAAAISRQQIEQ